jgi:HTH-type transcriptional regulator/antitoxin HigA
MGESNRFSLTYRNSSTPIKANPMILKILKTAEEYEAALNRLEAIFDSKKGDDSADELELLSLLIENYENQHFVVDLPDPIEAIKFRMDQLGYKQKDLAKALGQKSRVSEVLNKKRKLSIEMIRKLHETLGIPSEVLIRDY